MNANSPQNPGEDRPAKPRSAGGRLGFLDWTRGLAAVIMLQGHVFHAFTATELRGGSHYILSQFVGGMPPAIFLFLTGVTFAFLMDSVERQGLGVGARILTALRRSGYLFALAFLFRLQMWLFGLPDSPWTDLFKVDILNSMGLALGVMTVMAVFQTADRVRLCAFLGLAIAAAAPLVSALDWTSAPPLVKAYLAPDPNSFSFFPWAAFLAFGMSAGSVLRLAGREGMDRILQWAALLGLGLIAGGRYFADLPISIYAKSDFWLNNPSLVFIKLGVILVMTAFAYLWFEYVVRERWSWVRQLGMTSLLVYWVHTELVYGRWLWILRDALTVPQTVTVAAAVIGLMLGLSILRTQWNEVKGHLRAPGLPFGTRLALVAVTVRDSVRSR